LFDEILYVLGDGIESISCSLLFLVGRRKILAKLLAEAVEIG
jgi:hypothetical protein